MNERPKMQVGHLSGFLFKGPLSLTNKIKNDSVPFSEKTVHSTALQMVLNERTPKNAGGLSFVFFI